MERKKSYDPCSQEAGMMCKFEHENVLGLLGISLDKLLRFVFN